MKATLLALALTAAALTFTTGCEQAAQQALEQVQAEVMQVHDQVMPQMQRLTAMRTSLSSLRDSLVQAKVPTAPIDSAVVALTASENAMNTWMEQFDGDFAKNLDGTQALAYISGQLVQVQQMSQQVSSAVVQAEGVLRQYGRNIPAAVEAAGAEHGGHGQH